MALFTVGLNGEYRHPNCEVWGYLSVIESLSQIYKLDMTNSVCYLILQMCRAHYKKFRPFFLSLTSFSVQKLLNKNVCFYPHDLVYDL